MIKDVQLCSGIHINFEFEDEIKLNLLSRYFLIMLTYSFKKVAEVDWRQYCTCVIATDKKKYLESFQF